VEATSKARLAESGDQLLGWADSGGVAVITWHGASGDVHRQELASRRDAEELLAKIRRNAELTLVSAQVRRLGIGPDS
jgi:hypothetical protein